MPSKYKITINNQTYYDPQQVRAIFKECLKRSGVSTTRYVVRLLNKPANGIRCGTYCGKDYEGAHIDLCLRPEGKETPDFLADTIFHELDHVRGLVHKDMIAKYDVAWATGLPLQWKVPTEPTKLERLMMQHEHCARMIERWQKRVLSAQKMNTKWTQRWKRYALMIQKEMGVKTGGDEE